jgi:hypothetical protein
MLGGAATAVPAKPLIGGGLMVMQPLSLAMKGNDSGADPDTASRSVNYVRPNGCCGCGSVVR